MATVKLHSLRKFVFKIRDSLKGIIEHILQMIRNVWKNIENTVGPDQNPLPSALTTFASILAFSVFFAFLAVTSRWPTKNKRISMNIIVGTSVLIIIGLCIWDWYSGQGNRKMKYKRNLGNTVLALTLSMCVLILMYNFKWHEALNHIVLETTEEPMGSARYPSIAFFQRADWTSQAYLISNQSKCGLGWLWENSDNCAGAGQATLPCRCDAGFYPDTVQNFVWHNISYRYLALRSPPSFICTEESTQMIVQVFFYYNSAKAELDSSQKQSPSLYIAIHDPALTFQQALEQNFTRMTLIDANGQTAINLGLRYRQAVDYSEAYDYEMMISSVPAQNVACEWNGGDEYPITACFASLLIQYPTFDRRIIRRTHSMQWSDAVMEAGGFMSFVLLFAWTVSGLAFLTG